MIGKIFSHSSGLFSFFKPDSQIEAELSVDRRLEIRKSLFNLKSENGEGGASFEILFSSKAVDYLSRRSTASDLCDFTYKDHEEVQSALRSSYRFLSEDGQVLDHASTLHKEILHNVQNLVSFVRSYPGLSLNKEDKLLFETENRIFYQNYYACLETLVKDQEFSSGLARNFLRAENRLEQAYDRVMGTGLLPEEEDELMAYQEDSQENLELCLDRILLPEPTPERLRFFLEEDTRYNALLLKYVPADGFLDPMQRMSFENLDHQYIQGLSAFVFDNAPLSEQSVQKKRMELELFLKSVS